MTILNNLSLNSNRQININFDGGNLSSDSSMLFIHEFAIKLSLEEISKHDFSNNDNTVRKHTNSENAMQMNLHLSRFLQLSLIKNHLLRSLPCHVLSIDVMKFVYISLSSFIKSLDSKFILGKSQNIY